MGLFCDCVVFPATVTLIPCNHMEALEKDKGSLIYLGLKEPELCLFCTKVNEQPTLQLKVSTENKGLVTCSLDGNSRFLGSFKGQVIYYPYAYLFWFFLGCAYY